MDDNLTGSTRSRRQKIDKSGRLNALQALKGLKGSKHKYEVQSLKNVYEEVDEVEYSKHVRKRQDDDWIIDDDGNGYVEDGREIFDDDDDIQDTPKQSKKIDKKRTLGKKDLAPPKSSITAMFQSLPKKKKTEASAKLEQDNYLDEILNELNEGPSVIKPIVPTIMTKKKKSFASMTASSRTVPVISPFEKSYPASRNTTKHFVENGLESSSISKIKNKWQPSFEENEENNDSTFMEDELSHSLPNNNVIHVKSTKIDPETVKKELVPESNNTAAESKEDSDVVLNDADNFEEIPSSFFDSFAESDWGNSTEISSSNISNSQDMKAAQNKFKRSSDRLLFADTDLKEVLEYLNNNADESVASSMSQDSVPCSSSSEFPLVTNNAGAQVLHFFWLDAYEEPLKQPGTVYLFGKVQMGSSNFVSCCVTVKNIDRIVHVLPREKCFVTSFVNGRYCSDNKCESESDIQLDIARTSSLQSKINLQTGEETNEIVAMSDVYNEVDKLIAERFKIHEYKSKRVTKSYVFGLSDVPHESEYLEVKYSASYPALPADFKGETFSHVFGTTTSSLEQFLLNRKLKGPCWLEIKSPEISNVQISWCKLETVVNNINSIQVMQEQPSAPLISLLSLWIQTSTNSRNHQTEIISIIGLSHNKYPLEKGAPNPPRQSIFCILTKPTDGIFPFDYKEKLSQMKLKIDVVENERALISLALTRIYRLDPDILVGYDNVMYDFDILLQRISTKKVANWSRMGRLRRSIIPSYGGVLYKSSALTCGRILCDIKISARELIQSKSYDFCTLAESLLNELHTLISPEEIHSYYSDSHKLVCLIAYLTKMADMTLQMFAELNILPLAVQMTSIAGNLLSRTLLGGRSERNEYLLLHAFSEKNYITPDKILKKQGTKTDDDENEASKKAANRRKPAYLGGLVLDPKKGFYDKYILLMDFNSLYPSIIQEYNICFTTVPYAKMKSTDEVETSEIILPDAQLGPGILPVEIRKLVESRREVKKLLQTPNLSPDLKQRYEIRQKALKLMANSMYGCLGFSNSRFYAKHLAAMITGLGRQILLRTKDLVEKMNNEVIYGDTDSIMINTNSDDYSEVFRLGAKIKADVNKLYHCLEIDIDGVFRSVLLLKKKKYAALKVVVVNGLHKHVAEVKGLDIIRRDWSELACDTGKFVIDEVLSNKPRENIVDNIINRLEKIASDLLQSEIPLEKLVITKQLTKTPEEYLDKKSLPHVNVALRLNSKGGKKLRQGDTVSYIICQDGTDLPATQRAYHLDEIVSSEHLTIDTKYYLANQIHPVVSRICDPIGEIDSVRIAECLGLDIASYKSKITNDENEENDAMLGGLSQLSEEVKYRSCERINFTCPTCHQTITFEAIFNNSTSNIEIGLQCSNGTCQNSESVLTVLLYQATVQKLRSCIQRYYANWVKCSNINCGFRTKRLPIVSFNNGKETCTQCSKKSLQMEYTESQLYAQISYFQYLFDLEKAAKNLQQPLELIRRRLSPLMQRTLSVLKSLADAHMNNSAYSRVNLRNLFGPICSSVGSNDLKS